MRECLQCEKLFDEVEIPGDGHAPITYRNCPKCRHRINQDLEPIDYYRTSSNRVTSKYLNNKDKANGFDYRQIIEREILTAVRNAGHTLLDAVTLYYSGELEGTELETLIEVYVRESKA